MAHNYFQELKAALPEQPTVGSLVAATDAQLSQHPLHYGHGTENPADEAYTMVFDLLDLAYDKVEALWGTSVTDEAIRDVSEGIRKRIEDRLPLPYITGTAWFAD